MSLARHSPIEKGPIDVYGLTGTRAAMSSRHFRSDRGFARDLELVELLCPVLNLPIEA
jgi:hypothetical protein